MGRKKFEEYEEQEQEQEIVAAIDEIGCGFCYDNKHKRDIALFFIDRANNMRPCVFCPSCGRPLSEV